MEVLGFLMFEKRSNRGIEENGKNTNCRENAKRKGSLVEWEHCNNRDSCHIVEKADKN